MSWTVEILNALKLMVPIGVMLGVACDLVGGEDGFACHLGGPLVWVVAVDGGPGVSVVQL